MFNLILSIKPNINILVDDDICFISACKYNRIYIANRLMEINPIRYSIKIEKNVNRYKISSYGINKNYDYNLLMYCLNKSNYLNTIDADLIFQIREFMLL